MMVTPFARLLDCFFNEAEVEYNPTSSPFDRIFDGFGASSYRVFSRNVTAAELSSLTHFDAISRSHADKHFSRIATFLEGNSTF